MTEIATRPAGTLDQKMQYAQALASASLLPPAYRRQPGNVLLAIEVGESLGLSPITAINNIHVIDGRPSASAALVSALVRRAGHRLRVIGDDTHAVAEIVRADDQEFTYRSEWTVERAKTAGLLGKGGSWTNYRAAMLKARAITEVARDACQEVLSGLVQYTPEELGAVVTEDGSPLIYDAEQPGTPTAPPRSVDDIAADADGTDADADRLRELWREAAASRQLEIIVVDKETAETMQLGEYLRRRMRQLVRADGAVQQPDDGSQAIVDVPLPDDPETKTTDDSDPWARPAATS